MVVSVKSYSYTIFALDQCNVRTDQQAYVCLIIHGIPHVHGVFIIHIAILHLGRESATLRECAVGRDAASPHNFGRIPSFGAAIRAVGHSVAHVGGSATPVASPDPPAVQESAPIRGFQLPKSLSIACNAVGSTLCSRSCPAKKRTRERRAGSIPFKWYAAFDHWARAFPQDPFGSGSGRCLFGAYRMALLPPSTRRCAPDVFMYVNRPLRCNEYNG